MSKIKLTGSNSGYVEIDSAADAGNLTLSLPTSGTRLLSNTDNVFSGITTTAELDINGKIDVSTDIVGGRNLKVTGITTLSDDVTFTGASYNVLWDKSDNQLEFGDNAKVSFGGGLDMQLHSDGTNGVLRQNNNSGGLYIQADNFVQIGKVNAGTPIYGKFIKDGAVELYFNGNKKFETTNTGAVVTGICTATSFSGSGEGLTRTTPYSHRNKFINGSFAIWQRGTSSTSTGYLADRWYFGLSGGSATCSRQEHSGSQANFSGSQYYLRLAVTSSSDYIGIRQRIEDVRTLPEGQITVSFWARGHVNGNLAVWMTQNFGSGGSTDVDIAQQVTPYLQNDSTFRYYSLTFTVPSISGKTIGAGSYFQISFGQGTNTSSSAWTLDISNIQVEVGSVATPFEHRSYGEELARCQRYCYRLGGLGKQYQDVGTGFIGHNGTTDTGKVVVKLPTSMRTNPSVSVIGNTQGFWVHTGGGETGTSDMNAELTGSLGTLQVIMIRYG